MRKAIFINMLVLLSVLLVACGGAATPAPSTPSKPVNITVSTNPNPAATLAPGAHLPRAQVPGSAGAGDIELVFTVTDANGNPIEGAKVDVSADHTDMTGMTMDGAATDQGGGNYAINANFSMSGNWKLKVYVRKDGLDYQEEIDLKIQ